MITKEKTIRDLITPLSVSHAEAIAKVKQASGKDVVSTLQLEILRVLAVGIAKAQDAKGVLLPADSFNGGVIGMTKKQRAESLAVYQFTYDALQTQLAKLGEDVNRCEQMHAVIQSIGQIVQGGDASQVERLKEAFRTGPPKKDGTFRSVTINWVKNETREIVDEMMTSASISIKDSKGNTQSVSSYNERMERIHTLQARIEAEKDMGQGVKLSNVRSKLYGAFTERPDTFNMRDATAVPVAVQVMDLLTDQSPEEFDAIAHDLATHGIEVARTTVTN